MLFTLKKFIGGLLLPLPLFLAIIALGLVLLWFTRWQRSGKALISLAWLAILLLSLQPIADRLLLPLEKRYSTLNAQTPAKFIVVLGGGYTYNPQWAPSSNLLNNSLPRVTEGIRQLRLHPGAKIIFTGGVAQTSNISSARVAANVAESLGVSPDEIILLDTPKDTREEAQGIAGIVGHQPLILVTSANHLPRAVRFFEEQGLTPIPAPANQLAITSALNPWEKALPSAFYLGHSERAWYETLGSWWQNLTASNQQQE
ncbi:envelope biogenesis factor ElyC [Enterobacillus tribolii]|uniref:Envelope biogenesis factor ElyC n=1 Tax=Enterobacillus tribolii TaxID=1487935 RepID=A0A370QMH4_9GAMM|nr:envelope biogenesis factor ElyC [Enterobacillus tribolii]MBW7982408.1 envelope biogenesis factor ElyC [Enterobacillus tribolii]RDK89574.1 uncharacterized SAM-binding protein YcdF (DUF218 family) [Enterobacillus tribolii]